jgi:hypothetical protein
MDDWLVYSLTAWPLQSNRALRVLFLSADTGGGHRASAEALAKQVRLVGRLAISESISKKC